MWGNRRQLEEMNYGVGKEEEEKMNEAESIGFDCEEKMNQGWLPDFWLKEVGGCHLFKYGMLEKEQVWEGESWIIIDQHVAYTISHLEYRNPRV